MMIIEKVEGGYIVQTEDRKIIANAENVANLIMRSMKDVAQHIEKALRAKDTVTATPADPPPA